MEYAATKILVLGDIHGRTIWKDIVTAENPNLTIFLGDYVTTHEDITPEQQLSNLSDILTYKEENLDSVILLRGNHCLESLGYYWAECYPTEPKVREKLSKSPLKDRFLSLTQWIYIYNNILFSHAGVSKVWMENNNIKDVNDINKLESSEVFAFTPDSLHDMSGYSVTQPPVWIRPVSLLECNVDGYTQIVGHTPIKKIHCEEAPNGEYIWLCDALGDKQYLLIDNGIFIPKRFTL